MPRTGQPSTRDVEATVRAVEILDALADGGELGTTDVARRTGISAEHRLAAARHAHARRPRRARHRHRPLPARRADAPLRERRPRPAQPARPRPPPPRGARPPGRRDGDALDPRRRRRDHGRLRPDRPLPAGRDPARPTERRPRLLGRQGDARVRRRRRSPRASSPRSRRGRSSTQRALAAEIERVRARGYAEAIEEREVGLSAIAAPMWGATASSRRSLRCRGRRAGSTAAAIAAAAAAARRVRAAHLASRSAGAVTRARAQLSRWWQLYPAVDDSRLTPTPLRA